MSNSIRPFKLVAILDGRDTSATCDLLVERDDEVVSTLKWPDDWPKFVDTKFLKVHGFEVRIA